MTAIAIGQSQCRQAGGGGGADGLGLSPGGGGVACLLICSLTHVQLLVLPSMPGAGGAPAIGGDYPAIGQHAYGERQELLRRPPARRAGR